MQQQLNLLMGIDLALYGASGHGKVVLDILESNNQAVGVIIDDNPKVESLFKVPVLPASSVAIENVKQIIISIGNNKVRKIIANKINSNYAKALHKSAVISSHTSIGSGTVVMAGATINGDSSIGNHCIINTGAVVEHDCLIANFVHVSPGALLAGNVTVSEGAHVGIGAVVIQGIQIGKWATVGAGAVVIRDVPDYAVVVGNPARIIKYNK